MTMRVRFAPSPTGHLHIGGARTALYCQMAALAQGGTFVLRSEDTDLERSTKEFEQSIIDDLLWLGIVPQEGLASSPENLENAPYRQSECFGDYQRIAEDLVKEGLAFYDFCTEEELTRMQEESEKDGGKSYRGKWRDKEHWPKALERIEKGEKAPIRFLVPDEDQELVINDLVRGRVSQSTKVISDFVLLRASGVATYNFSCVIDDIRHKITHVLRGEEHLNNTAKQLLIYQALKHKAPEFAHLSLMIGSDRQKLSKRHGATSVKLYREQGYLPQAMNNYLCLLGWSHPQELSVFDVHQVKEFDLNRFNKAPAMYDLDKLRWTNEKHLRELSDADLLKHAREFVESDLNSLEDDELLAVLHLMKEKIQLITELSPLWRELKDFSRVEDSQQAKELLSLESTRDLKDFFQAKLVDQKTPDDYKAFIKEAQKELKVKGKPLFMGARLLLTLKTHGPDLPTFLSMLDPKQLHENLKRFDSLL